MTTIVVQYLPRADLADDNQRLVEDVFAELAQTQPDGIRYATWCLADDTFLHIAELSEDSNPLSVSAAFQRFQHDIVDRCEAGAAPTARTATLVGNHRFAPSPT